MKECRRLSTQEYRQIRDYMIAFRSDRDVAMVSFMRWTGYRIQEVLSVRLGDVCDANGRVYEQIHLDRNRLKGRRPRPAVMVHPQLRSDLERHVSKILESRPFSVHHTLFPSRKGSNRPISYTQAYRIIKEAQEGTDLYGTVACHSLRKTFATEYYQASGNDLRATQEALGHSSPVITQLYIGITPEVMKAGIMQQKY